MNDRQNGTANNILGQKGGLAGLPPTALDEALEMDWRDKKKNEKNSPPIPHLLQAQQAPALVYAKLVGRPVTESFPAPWPDPTTHKNRKS